MSHNRFYLDQELTGDLSLTGDEHHHLFRVMRNQEGDTITLINGKGSIATAEITSLNKKEALIHVIKTETQEKPTPLITLVQALPKKQNLELIAEKTCELGVDKIIIFQAERSPKGPLSPNAISRLNHILISSTKQCDRLYLPVLQVVSSIQDIPKEPITYLIGDLDEKAPRIGPAQKETAIFIGPEPGFTADEIAYIKKQFSACGVSLNRNTLRAETAAITALALLTT